MLDVPFNLKVANTSATENTVWAQLQTDNAPPLTQSTR